MNYADSSSSGESKNVLVKVNLCFDCALKLNYKKLKDKIKKDKKKKDKRKNKHKKHHKKHHIDDKDKKGSNDEDGGRD